MIYYFNPGHETAVKNSSPYYTAPANIAAMKKELSFLPAWYANSGDVVLVDEDIDEDFYNGLSDNLEFDIKAITGRNLIGYAQEEVCLWGISPQGVHFFEELNKEYSLELKIPQWQDEYIYLNGRQIAKDVLSELINLNASLSDSLLPQFYSQLEDIECEVRKADYQLLAKAPYSSSGRGLLWLPIGELTRTERQILHGALKKQGAVSIERALDRQVDFAMEFACDGNEQVQFVGYSLFETNKKGAYLGNILLPQSQIEERLGQMVSQDILDKTKTDLLHILSKKYASYKGYLGVDMMIYKENEAFCLHPCVEINMRANMGIVAINIQQRYLSPLSKGKFYIDFSAKDGEVYRKHSEMRDSYPLQLENSRLRRGYMPLCPVRPDSHYRAYVIAD